MKHNHPFVCSRTASPWQCFDWNAHGEMGIVRVLVGPGTPNREELWQRLLDDRMTQPFIFDTGEERRLHLSWLDTQSTLLRRQPDGLVAQYARKMMTFLLLNPTPRRILMLGLGGGELARFCYQRLPQSDITVVELDPQIIALREEFQVPADDHRFRVVQADGADYVGDYFELVDVLLVDAFDRDGIAPTLAYMHFYRSATRCLNARGVLAMNFWGDRNRYVANLSYATLVFGRHLRLVSTPNGNIVMFAARGGLPDGPTDELARRAERLKRILSLDFPRYLHRLCQGESLA